MKKLLTIVCLLLTASVTKVHNASLAQVPKK